MYRNEWIPEVFNDYLTNNMSKISATAPAINVLEHEQYYKVEMAAPGLRKEDFDVNINAEGDLTIHMENKRANEKDAKQVHYLKREFSYTKFSQTLILPEDVDRDKISASVADGVLTVSLPKIIKEEKKIAHQISIE